MTPVAGGSPRSGEEIQAALRTFVVRWKDYSGTERSEAQTFLNELFACYGTSRLDVGARFEDFQASASGSGFMDLHWPEVVIIEMKRPSRGNQLSRAQTQVMDYWRESADSDKDQPAARYVVICSFLQFEVWEPGRYPKGPRIVFDIEDLPDRSESLAFLAAPNLVPSFVDHYRELTKDAASIARLYQSLKDRSAAPIDEVQRFVMQTVWSLFAEDLGMIDGYPLQNIVQVLRRDPSRSSAAEIGMLFRVLNQKGHHNRQGVLAGTRYVNGELFAKPAEVGLNQDELALVATAAEHDWRKVDPTIFASHSAVRGGILYRETVRRDWESKGTVPNNAVCVFAFEDDFSMGVLQSRVHVAWAWAQSSTLKGDLRYTPTSVFMTFPWAGAFASSEQRDRVADACRRLLARRSEICLAENIGLTTLYNQVDDGAWTDLKALHRELDVAVADCYGWPRSVAQDDAEIVRRLTALNREIVEGSTAYEPFAYLERQTQS